MSTDISKSFKDSVWLGIPGSQKRNLLLGCIYRSGTPEKAIPLDNQLHTMINTLATDKAFSDITIVGDFNHPAITWTPAPHVIHNHAPGHPDLLFVQCILDSFLHQHIEQPTRYRANQQPTLDDLILSSNEHLIEDISYGSHLGQSDHLSLSFTVDFNADHQGNASHRTYRYCKTDLTKFGDMMNCDWEEIFADMTIEDA